MSGMRLPIAERFWAKVAVDPDTGCWLWTASVNDSGYGKLGREGAGNGWMRAHRFSYALHHGPIPDGYDVDHLCREPRCCNPAHLEAVPHRTNMRRSNAPMGINARKTHCNAGHAFDDENTHITPRGKRHCRACDRIAHRKVAA